MAGDKIIFVDNIVGEENGEFSSQWDLHSGNAELASYGGEPVINIVQLGNSIRPLIKREKWVPETFTVEFDLLFDSNNPNVAYNVYLIEETPDYNESLHGDFWYPINIRANGIRFMEIGSISQEIKAAAMKAYLVSQGITENRLASKGWGEFKPLNKNTTSEAKSNNRRVEFVKL
jgi:hypothetical protein